MDRIGTALRVLGLTIAALLLGSCATNPVSGRSDLTLMSEKQEIEVGKKAHQQILATIGAYEDMDLQDYVNTVGQKLAKASHRPNLEYHFTVIDEEDVNAFALPGGFIYISRGILPYLDSEAELAAVLGHEIGHVTARHAIRQQTQGLLAGIGATAAAILTGQSAIGDLANTMGGAIVSGYGRDMELEADGLGAEYLARTGYNPEAMIDVVRVLKAQESFEVEQAKLEGRTPRIYHGVFASHPDNDTRLQGAVRAAAKVDGRKTGTTENREVFLGHIDGLAFGPSRSQGIIRESRFYHADLGFTLAYPRDWLIVNKRENVVAVSKMKDAYLEMTTSAIPPGFETPQKFTVRLLQGLSLSDTREYEINGLTAYTAVARSAQTPFGVKPMRVVVVELNNLYYIFKGASRGGSPRPDADPLMLSAVGTFRRLRDNEYALAEPDKIRIVKANSATNFQTLALVSPLKKYPTQQLRLINGLYPDKEPAAGQLMKVVQ